tara:strand:+ start:574 stop:1161 length:588 start_codon:yes stop_codon:yes gene_type:complete
MGSFDRDLNPRIVQMPDSDAVRRLLEGDINPVEIEQDPGLYSMAERIYGSEALEEMGVHAPEIGEISEEVNFGMISDDISLPEFIPALPDLKVGANGKSRRWGLVFFGLSGLSGTIFNMVVGVGAILCSTGIANMREICSSDYEQTKIVWTKGYSWDGLHQIDTWVKPMTEPLVGDLLIISFFAVIAIAGWFLRK